MKLTYKNTLVFCFIGYIVQAISINFLPLLFITFQDTYGIPLSQITLLVTINFLVQLTVDISAPLYVDRLGYRGCIVTAHIFSAAGFLLLMTLPEILPPFTGLLLSVITYAIGSGLIEVMISPITEACPTDNKEKAMSLLHSFYCWGQVGVVLISTVFFAVFGIENWRILAGVWAVVPLVNGFFFSKTPIAPLIAEGERGMKIGELLRSKVFWVLIIMMLCSGASEHVIVQWASAFAEKGLGITKTLGDLAGPMAFGILMGLTRVFYGKYGEKINLDKFILGSGILCIIAFSLVVFVPSPVINLIGCALCGIGVAILWPGTLSKAAVSLRNGGTTMFAWLAVAGDMGCSAGPTVVGLVSGAMGDNLKAGIFAGMVFPIALVICLLMNFKKKEK